MENRNLFTWEDRIKCMYHSRNKHQARAINQRDDNSHWSKRSPFDHTCSAVAADRTDKRFAKVADSCRRGSGSYEEKKKNKRSDPETRLTLATTRSPLAWRLVHSKRLVSPLARNRAATSSLEFSSSKASLRSRHYGSGACNGKRRRGVRLKKKLRNESYLPQRAKRRASTLAIWNTSHTCCFLMRDVSWVFAAYISLRAH